MPKVKLVAEYNGAGFSGWQEQPGQRTIQNELKRALSIVLREEITWVLASGRTDSGVHAKAQVVAFRCESEPDLYKVVHGVSNILKNEVSVIDATIIGDDFHPVRDSKTKHYRYTIYRRIAPPVHDYGRVWHISRSLDLDLMKSNARLLEGRHDFSCFKSSDCNAPDPVKTLYSSEITQRDHYIYYDVVGSGFLKQMIRVIIGTLVELSSEINTLTSLEEILAAKDRTLAGQTAPPYGLCLMGVEY